MRYHLCMGLTSWTTCHTHTAMTSKLLLQYHYTVHAINHGLQLLTWIVPSYIASRQLVSQSM